MNLGTFPGSNPGTGTFVIMCGVSTLYGSPLNQSLYLTAGLQGEAPMLRIDVDLPCLPVVWQVALHGRLGRILTCISLDGGTPWSPGGHTSLGGQLLVWYSDNEFSPTHWYARVHISQTSIKFEEVFDWENPGWNK